jgi:hypothetical protein
MKKIIVIVFAIIIGIVLFYKIAKVFSPGSYPYSEIYEMDMNDSLLIEQIQQFKQKNNSYKVPLESDLVDDTYNKESNRFIFYFYYKEENKIVMTWVRSIDKEHSQLGIVSISDGIELANTKELNNDYGFSETIKEREKFENKILKNLNSNFDRKSIF